MQVINTLAPVVLIILLGVALRKFNFFSIEFVAGLNRLVYWIALPALLFLNISTADYDLTLAGKTALTVLIGMVAAIIASYLLARIFRLPRDTAFQFICLSRSPEKQHPIRWCLHVCLEFCMP